MRLESHGISKQAQRDGRHEAVSLRFDPRSSTNAVSQLLLNAYVDSQDDERLESGFGERQHQRAIRRVQGTPRQ